MTAMKQEAAEEAPAKKAPTASNRRRHATVATKESRPGWIGYSFLTLVLVAAVYPLYWSLMIASGDETTIVKRQVLAAPGPNLLANFRDVIDSPTVHFWQSTINSLIVSVVVAASVVFFSTLSGYAFAKLKFKGSTGLLYFVIATLAVPTQLAVVPLFIIMIRLQQVGTLASVILPALVSAFGVFWMTQYLRNALPFELIEAARVDGASMFRTFWSIALPIARPAAAMLSLFIFIQTWTNFFWPYITLKGSEATTLPVALATLSNNYFNDYSLILAGVLLSIIPLLLLFLLVGRQLVKGIMEGAVKG
jgi:cellobiose transport system permease protein